MPHNRTSHPPTPDEVEARRADLNQGGGDLSGTLPPENPELSDQRGPLDPKLPDGTLDQLTALKILLRKSSEVAAKSGVEKGLATSFEALRESAQFDPSAISGQSFGRIVDFVGSQVTRPIETSFENISDIIEGIQSRRDQLQSQTNQLRDDARQNIQLAINSGFWNDMPLASKRQLWETAGYIGDPQSATKNTGNDIIKINDYYSINDKFNELFGVSFPSDIIGMSEDEFMDQLTAETPPEWFRNVAEQQAAASLNPNAIINLWKEFKKKIQQSSGLFGGGLPTSRTGEFGVLGGGGQLPNPVE